VQQLLKVLIVTVPTGFCTLSPLPAAAADRIALVGCDLTASDGPTATFLQIGGEPGKRGRFASQTDGVSEDVAGRSCAKVLADLVDDGFAFRSANVSGRALNQWVSIWQASK
jgi:hypothetical protein